MSTCGDCVEYRHFGCPRAISTPGGHLVMPDEQPCAVFRARWAEVDPAARLASLESQLDASEAAREKADLDIWRARRDLCGCLDTPDNPDAANPGERTLEQIVEAVIGRVDEIEAQVVASEAFAASCKASLDRQTEIADECAEEAQRYLAERDRAVRVLRDIRRSYGLDEYTLRAIAAAIGGET